MTNKLTEIIEDFKIGENTFKKIKINQKKIIDEPLLIKNLGNELLTYLSQQGEENYHPDFSDSNAHYCLDFSDVEYISCAFFGKLITLNRKHKQNKNNIKLGLLGMNSQNYETLKITKLDTLFKFYKNNKDYKDNIESHLSK